MKSLITPRLRKPAVVALTGILFAVAWLVRGGALWWISIPALIAGIARAVSYYRLGGQDTDEGALAGSRADERQQLVGLRSRSLACNFAVVAAFGGLLAAIADRATWWWPFLVILVVTGFGYLFGLSTYGSGEPDPGDADEGADTGHSARSPAQS
jgi:hypothetical protein